MGKNILTASVVLAVLLSLAAVTQAQVFPGLAGASSGWIANAAYTRGPGFYVDPGIRKFINSFASRQFPAQPGTARAGTDPLSRLENPIDQWFIGLQCSQVYSTVSLTIDLFAKLNGESNLKHQDSDWQRPDLPGQKTTFSDSGCRLDEGYLLDISADWSPVPGLATWLKPVVGLRWQSFYFVTHDGLQRTLLGGHPDFLAGDGTNERYTFKHFYFGARSGLALGPFGLGLQGDYGLITADMTDVHVRRDGDRTDENGRGYCWHVCAAASATVRTSVNVKLEWDFKRLVATDCSHRMMHLDSHDTWDGAKIWSDQQTISVYAEFLF
jgi:hypothetical protein